MTPRFWRDFVVTLLVVLVLALAGEGARCVVTGHRDLVEQRALIDTLHHKVEQLDSARVADSTLGAAMRLDSTDYAAERAALQTRLAAYARLSASPQRVAARTGGESVQDDVPTPPPNSSTVDSGRVTAGEPSSTARTLDDAPLSVEALSTIPSSVLAPFAVSADKAARSCYAARTSCEARADSADAVAHRAVAALDHANARARRATVLRIAEDIGVFLLGRAMH